jgi:hypothetical protein
MKNKNGVTEITLRLKQEFVEINQYNTMHILLFMMPSIHLIRVRML